MTVRFSWIVILVAVVHDRLRPWSASYAHKLQPVLTAPVRHRPYAQRAVDHVRNLLYRDDDRHPPVEDDALLPTVRVRHARGEIDRLQHAVDDAGDRGVTRLPPERALEGCG